MPKLEPLTISSGSMKPIIEVGETVFLEPGYPSPKAGDIIAFKTMNEDSIVVHRLLGSHTFFNRTYLIQSPEEGTKPTVVNFERYLGKVHLDESKKKQEGFEWRSITMAERLRASKVFLRYIIGANLRRWLNR